MSETEKNQREQNRKRDTFIATCLVVVSFIFLGNRKQAAGEIPKNSKKINF